MVNAFRYVYTVGGNQAYMIKGNGGSGTVSNVVFENFISRDTAYGLDINEYWASMSPLDGPGVTLENITFRVQLMLHCSTQPTNQAS